MGDAGKAGTGPVWGVTGKGGAVPILVEERESGTGLGGDWYRRGGAGPVWGRLVPSIGGGGARQGMLSQFGVEWGAIGYWGERGLYWDTAGDERVLMGAWYQQGRDVARGGGTGVRPGPALGGRKLRSRAGAWLWHRGAWGTG